MCASALTLCDTEHYLLRLDRQCRLLIATRKPRPFESLAEIKPCFERIQRELAGVPRARYKLLVDVRQGPSRNDAAFEAELARYRGLLLFGFAKNAALRRTMAGQLQIQRYAQKDSRDVLITSSPREAFAYLGVPMHPL